MAGKAKLTKLSVAEVNKLKGHLLEVRRIGSKPIFIKVVTRTSIANALKNADIPNDSETKVEGQKEGSNTWKVVELKSKAIKYGKIAVTTKVRGA